MGTSNLNFCVSVFFTFKGAWAVSKIICGSGSFFSSFGFVQNYWYTVVFIEQLKLRVGVLCWKYQMNPNYYIEHFIRMKNTAAEQHHIFYDKSKREKLFLIYNSVVFCWVCETLKFSSVRVPMLLHIIHRYSNYSNKNPLTIDLFCCFPSWF